MEYELYVIYDSATGYYTVPAAQVNDADAMRNFQHEAMNPQSIWNSHPQDFILYKVGIFHNTDGTIQAFQSPERICSAADFLRKE